MIWRILQALGLLVLAGTTPAFAVVPGCNQLTNQACAVGPPSTQTIQIDWTMATGKTFTASNFGVAFTESDTNPSCAAGDFNFYADASENKLKKCENGTVSDVGSGGGGSSAWSSITNPAGNLALTMGANTSTFTFNAATGAGVDLFSLVDTASNTGTGYIFNVNTASGSAAKPIRFAAGGNANGVEMSTSGVLQKIGTGGIIGSDLVCTDCAGAADVAAGALLLNEIGNPGGNISFTMSDRTETRTWGGDTSTFNLFNLQDTAGNTGTGYLLNVNTMATSNLKPFRVTARGTANGVAMDASSALLAPIGTGGIRASDVQCTDCVSNLEISEVAINKLSGEGLVNTPDMADSKVNWAYTSASLGVGAHVLFEVSNAASVLTGGDDYVVGISTGSGNTGVKPFRVTAQGIVNGVEMSTSGALAKIGSGSIQADDVACTTCIGTTDLADNAVSGAKIALGSDTTGDIMYYDGTDWVRLGIGTGTQFLKGGTTPSWDTPTAATAWNAIANPSGALALTMGANTSSFTYNAATGASVNMFNLTDTASNTGTGFLFTVATAAGSAASPVSFTSQGTANGVTLDSTGEFKAIGTGKNTANDLTCTNCVAGTEIAITSQATGDLMYYDGTDWVRIPAGTASQVLAGGAAPAFGGIVASMLGAGDLANVLAWNETPGGSWPNLTLANSPRAADTALIVNNGIVLTRHADCTGSDTNEYMLSGTTLTMCDSSGGGTVRAIYEM